MDLNAERPHAVPGEGPSQNAPLGGEVQTDLTATGPCGQRALLASPPPRWRSNSTGETAKAAAVAMKAKAPTLRQMVFAEIERAPAIPETILQSLRSRGVKTVLTSIRPRASELVRMGLIADSGLRQRGEGGCKAIVWRATTPEERAAFAAKTEAGQ